MLGRFFRTENRREPLLLAAISLLAVVTAPQPLSAQFKPDAPFPLRGFRAGPLTPPRATPAAVVEEEIEGAARVAVVNLDRMPLGALVEARLRDKKIVNWWPRWATARLLTEARVHAGLDLSASPPEADADQLSLPDALILVRAWVVGETRMAEVVVCEPALGLRLGVQQVKLSGDAAKDVDALAGAAIGGLKKLGETMRLLWAVPPFRSNDLTETSGDLRSPLALEAEQALLAHKGSFTIELPYAHVVAAARRVAGVEKGISRPPPRMLLGEYRHEAVNPPALALSVTVQDSETPGERKSLPAATHEAAIQELRTHVSQLAKSGKEGLPPADDGSAEKNRIAAASRAYQKDGNWRAALELAESRLLVDPADRQWRSQAIGFAARIVRDQAEAARRLEPPPQPGTPPGVPGPRRVAPPPAYVAAVVETLDTYRRAMAHFERQLTTSPPPQAGGTYAWIPPPGSDFVFTQLAFSPLLDQSPELSALVRDFRRRRQELVMRYNEIAAANGEAGDMIVLSDLSPEERRALVIRMLVDFRHYPRPEVRNQVYINAAFNYQGGRENVEPFLAQLETLSDPTVKNMVAQQRQMLARAAAARTSRPATAVTPAPMPPKPPAPDPDAQIVFTPLSLPWKTLQEGPEAREVCELALPLGKAGDLFCYRGQIVLARKKGDYKLIWEGSPNLMFRHMTSAGYGPSLACFDGKFAWVPLVDPGKPSRLLVIDPATEKVIEVTAKEGLPGDASVGSNNPLLGATALAPGKVLLAGSFGRAWLGFATFDADKGAVVKIIHEARDLPVQGERDQHLSASLAFDPTWLFTLAGKSAEGKPLVRVLVGRYASGTSASTFPLIVDPDGGKVEVLTTPLTGGSDIRPAAYGGEVYWTTPWNQNAISGVEVWRLALPELQPQSIAKKPLGQSTSYAAAAVEEGKVHVVVQQWLAAAGWDETLTPLRGTIPGFDYDRRLPVRSEIHGWLLLNTNQSRVHAVEFKESASPGR